MSSATRWAFSLADFGRLNHRMHNKMFIADGAFAVVGGRNIADEYFFRGGDGNFIDLDLLVTGEAVPQLESAFDVYWNSRRVYQLSAIEGPAGSAAERMDGFEKLTSQPETSTAAPVGATERDILNYTPLSTDIQHPPLKLLRGTIRVLADDPEKVGGRSEGGDDPTTVTSQVIEAVAAAREDVLFESPYFVPGKAALARIAKVRAKGVPVSVVTNSMAANDEPFVSAAYARYGRTC